MTSLPYLQVKEKGSSEKETNEDSQVTVGESSRVRGNEVVQ